MAIEEIVGAVEIVGLPEGALEVVGAVEMVGAVVIYESVKDILINCKMT